jgi:putative transposase
MDETDSKVKGGWHSLDRAVDKQGQTMDCLRTEHRDQEAALRLLKQAIRRHGVPEQMTSDGRDAHAAASKRDNEAHGTHLIIRQGKDCNNIVEQDHRGVKRVTRPRRGLKSCTAAQDTLVGSALLHMSKRRQLVVEEGDEGLTAAALFYSLAASSPHSQGPLSLHNLPSKICDKAGDGTSPMP